MKYFYGLKNNTTGKFKRTYRTPSYNAKNAVFLIKGNADRALRQSALSVQEMYTVEIMAEAEDV